jgi:hypothetical protein
LRRRGCRTVQAGREWLPSQNGAFLERLQAHHATVFSSVISTFLGPNAVPLWEPSQKGWLWDRPHAHQ